MFLICSLQVSCPDFNHLVLRTNMLLTIQFLISFLIKNEVVDKCSNQCNPYSDGFVQEICMGKYGLTCFISFPLKRASAVHLRSTLNVSQVTQHKNAPTDLFSLG